MPPSGGVRSTRDKDDPYKTEILLKRYCCKGSIWLHALFASCIVVSVAMMASPAFAQQSAGAAPMEPAKPAAPPPASPAADAANPSPDHIAKARKLILATGISRSFQIIVPEFMDQIGNTLTQARPDLVHDMIIVLEQLKPEFEKQSDEMIDLSARIYATLLTEKDLDAILAFYDSDAGKKYVAAQSLYINQLIPGSQAWQQKIAINMMTRVRQEMKKKGHDL